MHEDIHPQVQAVLTKAAELNLPLVQDLSTEDARAFVEQMTRTRRETYPAPKVHEVENATTGPGFGHVPVRIYRAKSSRPTPAIVFYHGGGHVICSLDSHDTICRFLARTCGCTLVSVDYRMGPEHPFPAAVEDCFEATRWVVSQSDILGIDQDRIAVCGDSAGGNLAAVVALMASKSDSVFVSAQVLIYPVIDYRGGTQSYSRYGKGYGVLEAETIAWFMERYLPNPAQRDDWRACPRNAPSHEGLPPCLLLTAECDVLYDEGVEYGEQMAAAGVPVEHVNFKGMTHGFFGYLGLVDDAATAHETVARYLHHIWTGRHEEERV